MKIITALIFAFALFLATLLAGGQSKSDKMYDAFSSKKAITSFTFSKSMIDAIDFSVNNDNTDKKVSGDLHKIRFMSYNAEKGKLSADDFTKKAIAMLPSSYKKYDTDGDDDIEIWLLGKREKYSECHVFTKGENSKNIRIVVSFFGDFTVNDIKKLSDKGKELSEV